MKFFVDKQIAIRNSRYFLFLFLLNVAIISGLNGLLFQFAFTTVNGGDSSSDLRFFFGASILSVCVFLWFTGESIKKFSNGTLISAKLGGKLLTTPFKSHAEHQYYNIVEEMAIASGLPVPAIFVLENESSVNAFAAGSSPRDAAVTVTQGALDHLTRDELQAVVGHEFSHILFEDMSLNGKVAGAVNGFMFFVKIAEGYFNATGKRTSRRHSKGGGGLHFVALGLWILGSIGFFLGRIMQSQISKQREFLADASSVQFTRNPRALASALAKISKKYGSDVYAVDRYEFGHFFFADVLNWHSTRWFNTHPSMEDRIFKLLGTSESIDSLYHSSLSSSGPVEGKTETSPEDKLGYLSLLSQLGVDSHKDLQASENCEINVLSIVVSLSHFREQMIKIVRENFSQGAILLEKNLHLIDGNSQFRYVIFQISLAVLKRKPQEFKIGLWALVKEAFLFDRKLTIEEGLYLYLLKSELVASKSISKSYFDENMLLKELARDLDWGSLEKALNQAEALSFTPRKKLFEITFKKLQTKNLHNIQEIELLLSQCLKLPPQNIKRAAS